MTPGITAPGVQAGSGSAPAGTQPDSFVLEPIVPAVGREAVATGGELARGKERLRYRAIPMTARNSSRKMAPEVAFEDRLLGIWPSFPSRLVLDVEPHREPFWMEEGIASRHGHGLDAT